MKTKLFQTENSWTLLFLRLVLGVVIFAHGAQKLLGWYGGFGFSGTMSFFTGTMGLPWLLGFLIIILESFGAIALIAGFATRIWAISFTGLAIGIVLTSHIQNGFFMNWSGKQAGEGVEYFLFWIAISVFLAISGGGKFSIDKAIILKN